MASAAVLKAWLLSHFKPFLVLVCVFFLTCSVCVTLQILETSLIVNKGLWMHNTMHVLQPQSTDVSFYHWEASCRSSHGWCGLPLWVPRHTGLALGVRTITVRHGILSLRAGMEPDLQGSFCKFTAVSVWLLLYFQVLLTPPYPRW